MNKLTGAILLSIALSMLPWGTEKVSAADFTVPHTFKGGDTVSADELNERFDNLEQQQRDFVTADLVGTWSCTEVQPISWITYLGWTVSADGLTMSATTTLTFTESAGKIYVSGTITPGSCLSTLCDGSVTAVVMKGNYLSPFGSIRKRSNTRFEFAALRSVGGGWEHCDKQNIPPLKPSNLAASASGTSITLTWTDNSSDETSFEVIRKDTASGTWAVVGTVTANTTTYLNTSVTSGTHWFRVIAKNANGSSLGSNVAKVSN